MSKSVNGFVSTSDLISGLTEVLHPTGVDAEILSGRSDTYFSQKVRNLKSHDTFQRDNYATNVPGGFCITSVGKEYLGAHSEALSYLFEEDFNYEDVKTAIESIASSGNRRVLPIEEIVSEGRVVTRNVQTRERSSHLTQIGH